MAHVVTESCIGCKDTACVETCPVDCFHEGEEMVYIDPEECIDCVACVSVCPVEAIFDSEDVPEGQEKWIQINADMVADLPVITESVS